MFYFLDSMIRSGSLNSFILLIAVFFSAVLSSKIENRQGLIFPSKYSSIVDILVSQLMKIVVV